MPAHKAIAHKVTHEVLWVVTQDFAKALSIKSPPSPRCTLLFDYTPLNTVELQGLMVNIANVMILVEFFVLF